MKPSSSSNINTNDYWSEVYKQEAPLGKTRVDSVRMEHLTRWVMARQEELSGRPSQVLDVGCGLGDVAAHFSKHDGITTFGMDISAVAIEKCAERFGNADHWKVGDASNEFPFPPAYFDVVWIGETLEHVSSPQAVIHNAVRVCSENGFVVVSTPYKRRNTSPEHVWEFGPEDIIRWSHIVGELVFLDCTLLPSWLTMFAVFRKQVKQEHT